jgi:hypothetical protein
LKFILSPDEVCYALGIPGWQAKYGYQNAGVTRS